jgi:hypothetical protein
VATVLRAPTAQDILAIDLMMDTVSISEVIDRNLDALKAVQIDRAEQFVPQIYLAQMQYLWAAVEPAAAQKASMRMINSHNGALTRPVFADLNELLAHGFSNRALIDADH